MKRIDIIVNRAVEEDLLDEFAATERPVNYTLAGPVHGDGSSGPRRGSAVWPEENVHFLLFTEDGTETEEIKNLFTRVKNKFPDMGMKCFISDGPLEIL